jgi:hypothetical protein
MRLPVMCHVEPGLCRRLYWRILAMLLLENGQLSFLRDTLPIVVDSSCIMVSSLDSFDFEGAITRMPPACEALEQHGPRNYQMDSHR